ncbi:MAG: hypothetical protein IT372_42690, partial [Polyangiaceae bacterium]|nr:hypothetical protein [Polyangiaceae bacterium]
MNETMLTGAQQKVVDFISKHGEIEATHLKARGLDVRAANNLVKAGLLTATNGVYRLRAVKTQPKEAKAKEAKEAKAKKDAPATVKPAEKAAPAAVTEPATTTDASVAEPAKADKAAKAEPKAKANKPAARPEKPAINPTERCLCGCGAEIGPKRRFSIGHDAKLHSLVLRVHRGKAKADEIPTEPTTLEYLKTAPWMTDEIAMAIN